MKRLLSISVTTKTWTEGNHAWFDVKLNPGAVVEVHWGDGTHSTFPQSTSHWSRVEHYYRCKGKEQAYEIEFLSEDENALLCLVDGTWEMTVNKVILKECPSLTELQYCQAENIDFGGSPNLEVVDCHEYYGENIDVSSLQMLKRLSIRMSPFIKTLNLTANPSIEILNIGYCNKLTKVSVSNASQLRLVSYDLTTLDRHSVEWIEKVVKKNDGEIVDWIDTAFTSMGILRK